MRIFNFLSYENAYYAEWHRWKARLVSIEFDLEMRDIEGYKELNKTDQKSLVTKIAELKSSEIEVS